MADAGHVVRRLGEEEWRAYRELRLRGLADDPDAFGSTLARERERPDSVWRERVTAAAASRLDAPLVADADGALVGLAWGKVFPDVPDVAHLFQMWVAPEVRGRGVGRSLVEAVVDWARQSPARRLVLGVTCGDTPARRLYERSGFVPEGDVEPLRPGSALMSQTMILRVD